MVISKSLALALASILYVSLTGCNATTGQTEAPSSNIISDSETGYCSTIVSVTNPTTISGTATYQARTVTAFGLTGTHTSNIRYAEIRVLNQAGSVVQCGETDSSGAFSIQIEQPSTSQSYTLQINSRAENAHLKVSVLKDIYSNSFFSLTTSFTADSASTSISLGTLAAPYNGTLEGGAFNIMDQILNTNEYLTSNSVHGDCPDCSAFSVPPKLIVYWSPGVSPSVYGGSDLSFFDRGGGLAGVPALYILGGLNGDVDNTDTDHFDNSILVHEYGHYLASVFSAEDSPGGQHNGNSITDPRLAFSEGFPTFLASAVYNNSLYRDTSGTSDGSTDTFLTINLETGSGLDIITNTSPVGEGIFREISVARTLWDYIDSAVESGETLTLPFAFIWKSLSSSTSGLKSTSLHFRTMGHFNQVLKSNLSSAYGGSAAEVTGLQTYVDSREYQRTDSLEYGQSRSPAGSSCDRTLTPTNRVSVPNLVTGELELTYNKHTSADYIQYYHAGGTLNLKLVYTQVSDPSPTDLNLYIFDENFALESQPFSYAAHPRNLESPVGTEELTVTASAGYYLIQVRWNDALGDSNKGSGAVYNLMSGSQYLCP